jgi:hypothetical protein
MVYVYLVINQEGSASIEHLSSQKASPYPVFGLKLDEKEEGRSVMNNNGKDDSNSASPDNLLLSVAA